MIRIRKVSISFCFNILNVCFYFLFGYIVVVDVLEFGKNCIIKYLEIYIFYYGNSIVFLV